MSLDKFLNPREQKRATELAKITPKPPTELSPCRYRTESPEKNEVQLRWEIVGFCQKSLCNVTKWACMHCMEENRNV